MTVRSPSADTAAASSPDAWRQRRIKAAILLLAIGVAVTEISLWGRRQQSQSGRREGYLAGVAHAARMAAVGSPPEDVVATVGRMIDTANSSRSR